MNMEKEYEKLLLDYINTCVDETLDANDGNLSKNQIAHVRKGVCDEIIEMTNEYGKEYVSSFLKERLNLTQK